MKKKIFACLQVQNDADILESFCRYYCSFCDGILITDDMSSDNTLEIIKSLADEGLPIFLTDNNTIKSNKDWPNIRNQQLHFAIDNYNADIILPIDVDEFLICTNDGNPRPILESLDETKEYHIMRRNYVCPRESKDNTIFFPSMTDKYTNLLSPKTIMHKFLLKEKNAFPTQGCHSFSYTNNPPDIINIDVLCYNHYPFRSIHQFMIKIILGWIEVCMRQHPETFTPWHWKLFYEEIKKHGIIPQEMLERFSIYNSTSIPDDNNCQLFESIFDTSFCQDKLKLRYTRYNNEKDNFIKILTTQLERNLVRMSNNEQITITPGLNRLKEKNIQLQSQLNALLNSKSWKITRPLRFLSRLIKK
jgi:glycosyltransferase involved in cell wall biosynthesis